MRDVGNEVGLVIGAKKKKKKTRAILSSNQKRNRNKSRDLLALVFPRFVSATLICLTFDWFTGWSVSLVTLRRENQFKHEQSPAVSLDL